MRDDIVKRLRSGFLSPTCALDAADEIEMLREGMAVISQELTKAIGMERWDIVIHVRNQIDAALKGDGNE